MNDSKEQMTKNVRNTIESFEKLLSVLECDFFVDEEELMSSVISVLCVTVDCLLSFFVVSEPIKHIGTPSSSSSW